MFIHAPCTTEPALFHPLPGEAPRWLLAAVAACALVLAGPTGPAAAHDELASSSPGNEASVQATPSEIVLTFSNPPSGIGAEIIVTDDEGTTWSEGPVSVVNNTAVQPLTPGAPAGQYTTRWRVVSSDDHPIEGTLTFTSTSPEPSSAHNTPGAAASAADSVTESATESATPGASSTPAETSSGTATEATDTTDAATDIPAFVFYLVGGGLLAAVALVLITRRRLSST